MNDENRRNANPGKKMYAFLLMGGHYDPDVHQCRFETAKNIVFIRSVRDFEEAKAMAVALQRQGVGAIEVCGAFGPEKARELTDLTGGEVAIGYIVHHPELDEVFAKFFG